MTQPWERRTTDGDLTELYDRVKRLEAERAGGSQGSTAAVQISQAAYSAATYDAAPYFGNWEPPAYNTYLSNPLTVAMTCPAPHDALVLDEPGTYWLTAVLNQYQATDIGTRIFQIVQDIGGTWNDALRSNEGVTLNETTPENAVLAANEQDDQMTFAVWGIYNLSDQHPDDFPRRLSVRFAGWAANFTVDASLAAIRITDPLTAIDPTA